MYLKNPIKIKPLILLVLISFVIVSCQEKEELLQTQTTTEYSEELESTAQGRDSEPVDLSITFEDFSPDESEIGGLIVHFSEQVQSGAEGEMPLNEAVWHSEAFINATFIEEYNIMSNFESIPVRFTLPAGPSSNQELPTVSLLELNENLIAVSNQIQEYINSGLTLAISDFIGIYDEGSNMSTLQASLLVSSSLLSNCASGDVPPLDGTDDWFAKTPLNSNSNAGKCPLTSPPNTPRGIRSAEERLEEIYNQDYCPGSACMGLPGCSLLRTVYTGVVSSTYNPINLQFYNNGSLYHTHNTSQCRDAQQMQTHVNGLNFLQGVYLPAGKTFILLDIETHFIQNPHLAPFFYQPPFNNDIYQWRPKFTYAKRTCIC